MEPIHQRSYSKPFSSAPFLEQKRGAVVEELGRLIASLRIEPIPDRRALVEGARQRFSEPGQGYSGYEVKGRVLWSYARHCLTNYDQVRAAVKARVGESELYENVKVYLCCRIVREYGLDVDPLYAAFGDNGGYGRIPDRFLVDNLEAAAAQMIFQAFQQGQ
ncbi:MAG: hypothetical protein HYV05_12830 [Deltaproteobacteria bacterium]|nr:hypothetical protein [Deltaproteobacteria bacterium]